MNYTQDRISKMLKMRVVITLKSGNYLKGTLTAVDPNTNCVLKDAKVYNSQDELLAEREELFLSGMNFLSICLGGKDED